MSLVNSLYVVAGGFNLNLFFLLNCFLLELCDCLCLTHLNALRLCSCIANVKLANSV